MYLWYHGTQKHWRFSRGLDFEARNDWCIMYIESQGTQDLVTYLNESLLKMFQINLRVRCQKTWKNMV